MDEILESVCTLAQDQYGNYVTQVGFFLFGLTLVKFLLSLTLRFSLSLLLTSINPLLIYMLEGDNIVFSYHSHAIEENI